MQICITRNNKIWILFEGKYHTEREKFIFRPIDSELALIQRNEFDGAENNYGIERIYHGAKGVSSWIDRSGYEIIIESKLKVECFSNVSN